MQLTNTFSVARPIEETWPVLCDLEKIAPCMPGAQLQEVEGDEYRGEVKVKVGPITAKFKGTAQMVERDDGAHRAVLEAKGRDTGGKGNANATIVATAEPDGDGTRVTVATELSITGKVAQFGRGALTDVSTKLLGQFVSCLETNVLAGGSAAEDDAVDHDAAVGESPDPEVSSPAGASPSPSAGETAAAPAGGGRAAAPAGTTPSPSTAPGATPEGSGAAHAVSPAPSAVRRIDAPANDPVDLLDVAGGSVAKQAAPVVGLAALALLFLWWRRRP